MNAVRILVARGITGPLLYDVVGLRAATVARLLYAALAWWGLRDNTIGADSIQQ